MKNEGDGRGSRRSFLAGAISATAAGAVSSSCTFVMNAMGTVFHPGAAPLAPTRKYPETAAAVVAAAGVRGSVEAAVRSAVEAAGGLADFEQGQRVMIKPNATGPVASGHRPITTNPEVVRAVIRMVKERGCRVMVGDRSATSDLETFRVSGFEQVCKEEGAELCPWIVGEYVRFFPRQRYWTDGFRLPKILTEVDHWINVPVLKNHQSTAAEFTCCLKSFVGVCHPEDRFQKGTNALHQRNIGEKIAELNLCSRPALNIVDATDIMIHGGPDGILAKPVWVKSNLVLAGRDRVACDSVALATLKRFGADNQIKLPYVTKSVWDQVQIYRAAELGIG